MDAKMEEKKYLPLATWWHTWKTPMNVSRGFYGNTWYYVTSCLCLLHPAAPPLAWITQRICCWCERVCTEKLPLRCVHRWKVNSGLTPKPILRILPGGHVWKRLMLVFLYLLAGLWISKASWRTLIIIFNISTAVVCTVTLSFVLTRNKIIVYPRMFNCSS